MGGFRQLIKERFKSKRDTILRKPYEDVNEFYTIDRELGSGTYGVTYRCTERSTGRSYACKKISKMRNNEVTMRRSQADHERNIGRQVEIMQLLSGRPNIVGFKSAHENEQFVHLVMYLCEGGELPVDQRYDERNAARICKQILEAVRACHSIRVMHRDVKPQNLLFSTSDHSNTLLKLSDFGVSVFIREGRREEDRVGTAPYTASEVINHRYGKEADMWSAGVILYSLLSGRLPFGREVAGQRMDRAIREGPINLEEDPWPSISPAAKDLVRKMLTRNPRERIAAAQALEDPWITSYDECEDEGMRKSLIKKLLKKLNELLACKVVNNKIKMKKGVHGRSRRHRYI